MKGGDLFGHGSAHSGGTRVYSRPTDGAGNGRPGGTPRTPRGLLGFPGDWRHDAACGDRGDDLFFPEGVTGAARKQEAEAKAICASCPVRRECLRWALDTAQPFGVWGGLSEAERRVIRRRRAS